MAELSKGAAGEVLAARFLREKGYAVVAANYHCRQGEIDIIVSDATYLVFVEVKTRKADSLYAPREAVTVTKQRRLLQTAGQYLSRFPTALQPRFDVVEVVTASDNPLQATEINHIIGAYEAGDLSGSF